MYMICISICLYLQLCIYIYTYILLGRNALCSRDAHCFGSSCEPVVNMACALRIPVVDSCYPAGPTCGSFYTHRTRDEVESAEWTEAACGAALLAMKGTARHDLGNRLGKSTSANRNSGIGSVFGYTKA